MKSFTVVVPYRGMSKPRPRVTENGTYNPPAYTEWKENVAEVLALKGVKLEGNVELAITFRKTDMLIHVEETGMSRFGRQDIDNECGGVMDALQDSGCIPNDNRVVSLHAYYSQG